MFIFSTQCMWITNRDLSSNLFHSANSVCPSDRIGQKATGKQFKWNPIWSQRFEIHQLRTQSFQWFNFHLMIFHRQILGIKFLIWNFESKKKNLHKLWTSVIWLEWDLKSLNGLKWLVMMQWTALQLLTKSALFYRIGENQESNLKDHIHAYPPGIRRFGCQNKQSIIEKVQFRADNHSCCFTESRVLSAG